MPKTNAMIPSVIVMPIEPMISSGLRPTRSIVAMAMSVVTMLTIAVMTVIMNESASLKPTACQRTFE